MTPCNVVQTSRVVWVSERDDEAAEAEDLRERYRAAAHAMQTGVATWMGRDPKPTEPKHLRVGVNSAMSDQAGLASLLIEKGVFTEIEYLRAVTEAMEAERDRYEKQLLEVFGMKVKLV